MDDKKIVLESCPFCGSAMRIFKIANVFRPECVDDRCIAGNVHAYYATKEEAIKACNERA